MLEDLWRGFHWLWGEHSWIIPCLKFPKVAFSFVAIIFLVKILRSLSYLILVPLRTFYQCICICTCCWAFHELGRLMWTFLEAILSPLLFIFANLFLEVLWAVALLSFFPFLCLLLPLILFQFFTKCFLSLFLLGWISVIVLVVVVVWFSCVVKIFVQFGFSGVSMLGSLFSVKILLHSSSFCQNFCRKSKMSERQ